MKRAGIEQVMVILLFVLVFIVFSFAERDSRKLGRLYKTAQLIHQQTPDASSVHVQEGKIKPTHP